VPSKQGAEMVIQSIETLSSAAVLFQHHLKLLSIDPKWFWEAWSIGNAAFPTGEWPRLGATTNQPGIYGVREAMTRLAIREPEPPPYINKTISTESECFQREQAERTRLTKEAHA